MGPTEKSDENGNPPPRPKKMKVYVDLIYIYLYQLGRYTKRLYMCIELLGLPMYTLYTGYRTWRKTERR